MMLGKPPRPPLTDHEERSKAITTLARLYGVTKFDDKRLNAILEAVAGVKTPHLLAACQVAAKTCDRFPTPSVLIRFAETFIRDGGDRTSPPPARGPAFEPRTAEEWLEAYGLEPRVEWLQGRPGRAAIERAIRDAEQCGQKDSCRAAKCQEQIPVPRTDLLHGETEPPTLTIAYGWCPEHESRCAWRAGNRPAEKREARG